MFSPSLPLNRKKFIKRLQDSLENFRLTAIQNKVIRKFLKKDYINKNPDELLNSSELKPMIDFDKILDRLY